MAARFTNPRDSRSPAINVVGHKGVNNVMGENLRYGFWAFTFWFQPQMESNMGKPLSPLVRHQIIAERQNGASLYSISNSLDVSYAAVWTLWDRFSNEGKSGLSPRYDNNGRTGPDRSCLIFRAACWLKRLHPEWGAVVIHTILKERYDEKKLVSARQMNRWFQKAGLSMRGSRMPENPKDWAKEVHDTWQVDAKEQVRTASGEHVCWLTTADEKSGGLLGASPFPPREDFPGSVEGGERPDGSPI
jgi:transposase